MENITNVSGNLYIQNNGSLQNINGLQIETVGGWLFIGGDDNINTNLQLTNLNGLSSLASVAEDIYISYNSVLTDISALQHTTFMPLDGYGLTIINNPALAVCNLPNFCTYLSNPAGSFPRNISGNLAECINEVAVAEACGISLCPPGNVTFTTQTQVDQFIIDYPNCTQINGYVAIGNQVQNLNGLSNITEITVSIDAGNATALVNINGLSNLTNVGQDVQFINTPLTNIDGLSSLTNIVGSVVFANNIALTNVNGLSSLTGIGGFLSIGDNTALTNVNGLSSLTGIGGFLSIGGNAALTNVDGLSSLTSLGSYLFFENNAALTNLDGLSNLESITHDIYIVDNIALSDISALQNTTFGPYDGYGLTITGNTALAVCNLPNFCTYLANSSDTHPRIIAGNLAECINEEAVAAACDAMGVDDFNNIEVTAYPNPVQSVLTLSSSNEISNITIVNMLGQKVLSANVRSTEAQMDLRALPAGSYFVKVSAGQAVKTIRILKQ
ncbi:T9SS type A sorting domain-containing protein [Flavobacterium sp. Sd200]|uniref:T9SS type A sorting domain-containing protein n=1 Tax=Flavobacterium sp. Sd200 TaxID=2692211 RepID=UPI0013681753|nr:T9SS type A sorting domain-containing protein [Flavobacterium sp. Sd200]MXN92345.1 T9SS type A sorting domain-containing protein [Flavobacterium sp. Sd200]